ncbi:MAG: ABC transporter substrate-binding protein, partial [Dehalococcoidia bacterium]|nr:ABC transporter substrate-binding protein [Dehalococcoidia bacterium]
MTTSAPTLRLAIPPGRVGFDAEQGGVNGDFHRLCYARLFQYAPAGLVAAVPDVVPWLAESYAVSEGGARYTIRLRADVRSPFGNPLTADDVVWGWQRAFALRDVGKWVALVGSVAGPESVTAVDRRTVAFDLRAPNPTFLQQLTRATPTIVDSVEARRHATATDPWASAWLARAPAGFGPYTLESWSFWGTYTFVANPGAPNPPPVFPRVEVRIVPGAARRVAMLRAGEIDLLPTLSPAEAVAL